MSNLVLVGYISGSHGIKGEVKVKALTSNFFNFPKLYLKNYDIINLNIKSSNKDIHICSIDKIDDRTKADELKGTEIYALRSDFPEITEKTEYYVTDLIGKTVYEMSQNIQIGEIINFYNFGAGDICEIKLVDGKTKLLPFNEITFPEINLEQGKVFCFIPDEV